MLRQSVKGYARVLAATIELPREKQKAVVAELALVLKQRRVLAALPKIIREARRQLAVTRRNRTVVIETSKSEGLEALVNMIRASAGASGSVQVNLNPAIIDGIILQRGDYRIDASVRKDLNALKENFLKSNFEYTQ